MTVDRDTFLKAAFDGRGDNEHVGLTVLRKAGGRWKTAPWPGTAVDRWAASKDPGATYVVVSTIKPPEDDYWRRGRADCVAAYLVVLDDIGSKVTKTPPVEPSYKMETSPGNFQWGYFLNYCDDLPRYEQIVEALCALGLTDEGMKGCYRVARIPGSVNIKEGPKNGFVSRVTDWHPGRFWDLDDLARDLGVDLQNLGTARSVKPSKGNGALPDIDVIDPLLDWLIENGHVVRDDGSEWVIVTCPWANEHTDDDFGTKYSPLGRGRPEWIDTRAFKCHHGHCENKRKFKQFSEWVRDEGGPNVGGYDPLAWLQHRYVYVTKGKKIADMYQRPHGGVWVYELDEWSMCHYGMIPIEGRDRPVLIKTAFLENHATRKLDSFAYVPCDDELTEQFDQAVVNTYVEPTWPETHELPEVFLEHMEYLLPGEGAYGKDKDLFLDWLAYKFQFPIKRSYAVLMVAENSYGVGRSWIRAMLSEALQGKVNTGTLGQLIGKGTSAEANFNDWGSRCQYLVVEEARDNMDQSDFYRGYEKFKQNVDTRTVPFRCNPKYDKIRDDVMYFNCLMFTNHSDAMIIPDDDRRLCVLSNPSERRDRAYYERLNAALDTDEPAKVYWFLKHRDVSKFDHVYPPQTEAKLKMIDQSKTSVDEVMDLALIKLKGDIVSKKALSKAVRKAARELEYPKIENESGNVVGRMWRKLGRLRLEAKNGARYTIDTAQEEVRCVRNRDKWVEVDQLRDETQIVNELKLNLEEALSQNKFPK